MLKIASFTLVAVATLLNTNSAFAANRQHKHCNLRGAAGKVIIQLYAGAASNGKIAEDIFSLNLASTELNVVSAKVTKREKILQTTVSEDGSTTTITSEVGLLVKAEKGISVSGTFDCVELQYEQL